MKIYQITNNYLVFTGSYICIGIVVRTMLCHIKIIFLHFGSYVTSIFSLIIMFFYLLLFW